jgi:hypothetical protein
MTYSTLNYTKTTDVQLPGSERERGLLEASSLYLGNNTKLPSVLIDEQLNRRVARYLNQSVIAEILPNERVARCSHLILPSASGVKVMYSEKVQKAHYKGLTVCGSIWSCPVCASKISERRRLEIRPALEMWGGRGGGLIMASYTLQHDLGDKLEGLKKVLYSSYDRLMSGWGWQEIKKRWGIVGLISSSELTWGPLFGWHPHKHALIFTAEKLSDSELKQSETEISARFRGILAKCGSYGHPEFSVDFRTGNVFEESDYCFKWGIDYELTKSNVKKGRDGHYSPFEIAQWAAAGDLQPVRLFQEYYQVYKGSHQLQYSHGLRSLLKMDQEKTDLELAVEEDKKASQLDEIARSAWYGIVCKKNLRGEVLKVASSGSAEDLSEFLKSIGVA